MTRALLSTVGSPISGTLLVAGRGHRPRPVHLSGRCNFQGIDFTSAPKGDSNPLFLHGGTNPAAPKGSKHAEGTLPMGPKLSPGFQMSRKMRDIVETERLKLHDGLHGSHQRLLLVVGHLVLVEAREYNHAIHKFKSYALL